MSQQEINLKQMYERRAVRRFKSIFITRGSCVHFKEAFSRPYSFIEGNQRSLYCKKFAAAMIIIRRHPMNIRWAELERAAAGAVRAIVF